MRDFCGENSNSEISILSRRFNCGSRLKIAREDLSLPASNLIESINFYSKKEWLAIEDQENEIEEKYIISMANFSGISTDWIKHGEGIKYPYTNIADYDSVDKVLLPNGFITSYIALETESMSAFLVVKLTEHRYNIYSFNFKLDFWNWMGDSHAIPRIWQLFQAIDKKLRPYGKIISKQLLEDTLSGNIHPSKVVKQLGQTTHWFDDLFDVDYKHPIAKNQYSHHGDWFVKLQSEIRYCQNDTKNKNLN